MVSGCEKAKYYHIQTFLNHSSTVQPPVDGLLNPKYILAAIYYSDKESFVSFTMPNGKWLTNGKNCSKVLL